MSQQAKLTNISFTIILKKIFDFIKDNKFKYRLFVHSKHFQNLLGLDIVDYENLYISKFKMELGEFFKCEYDSNSKSFNKNCLKDIFDKKMKENKLDEKLIKKIITDNFEKIDKNLEEKCKPIYNIDVFSPLLYDISTTKAFEKQFVIEIQCDIIEKFKLENDYKEIFDKLNKINANYSMISFIFKNYNDITLLKKLNINLSKIKKLSIKKKKENGNFFDEEKENEDKKEEYKKEEGKKEEEKEEGKNEEEEKQEDKKRKENLYKKSDTINLSSSPESLFKDLFSTNELYDNLSFLEIDIGKKKESASFYDKNSFISIESTCFDNLNNFKSLKYLSLNYLKFKDNYTFNLKTLENLNLAFCWNFEVTQNLCNNLKTFIFDWCNFVEIKSPLNFPKLESYQYNDIKKKLINYSSLNNLKIFRGNVFEFLLLKDSFLLNEIHLENKQAKQQTLTFIKEKEIFEKILLLKKLKTAEFFIKELDDDEILFIPGENISLENLIFHWNNENKDCNIINLQSKFPNLRKLILKKNDLEPLFDAEPIKIEIKEDKNCKITNFTIKSCIKKNIKFKCAPYSNLVNVNFKNWDEILNLNEMFPLFNENCEIKFSSLKKFKFFTAHNISLEILKNLYNNLDNLPIIEDIHIECNSDFYIDEDFHEKFIKKLLSLKLVKLTFIIKHSHFFGEDQYDNKELEVIYPDIEFDKYDELVITKLGD